MITKPVYNVIDIDGTVFYGDGECINTDRENLNNILLAVDFVIDVYMLWTERIK